MPEKQMIDRCMTEAKRKLHDMLNRSGSVTPVEVEHFLTFVVGAAVLQAKVEVLRELGVSGGEQ